jgi:RNA polymerase sigma factor (sigma-70 family)
MSVVTDEYRDSFDMYWRRMMGIAALVFRRMRISTNDDDAWQIARIALWYAMQRHKPERGSLTTYYYRVLQSHLSEYMASCHPGIQYPTSLMRASKRIKQKRLNPVEVFSLDYCYDPSDPSNTRADTIADPVSLNDVERRIALEQMMDKFRAHLSPKQHTVLSMLLGLYGFYPVDVQEAAKQLNIPAVDVRYAYHNAIMKLRRMVLKDAKLSTELMAIIQ